MRHTKHIARKFLTAMLSMFAVGSLMTIGASAAGTASFTLSPSGGTYEINSTLVVVVNVASDEGVDAVTADINYNPSHLDYTGASFSGSAFPVGYLESDNGNTVSISRSIQGGSQPVSGTNKFATLNFKVLGSSGTTSLTFGPGSGIASAGDDVWNGSPTGGTYAMSAPAPAASTPAPSGSNSGGQNSASTTTATSGQPSQQVVQANAELDDDQPVQVDGYTDQTGYLVAIRVINKDGNPVVGTEVMLGELKATTDDDGLASFTGVGVGTYKAKVLGVEQSVTVTTGDPGIVQEFVVTSTEKQKNNLVLYAGIALGALALLAVVLIAVIKLRGGGTGSGRGAPLAQPAVTGNTPPPTVLDKPISTPAQGSVIKPSNQAPTESSTNSVE